MQQFSVQVRAVLPKQANMTTKIQLQPPYSERWSNGYLVTNTENRKTLILYNSPQDRSSCQYARYLLATLLGRYLDDSEQVDHIDNDKTNDSPDNLAIITQKDNLAKAGLIRRKNTHGTLTMYRYCKCELCVLAKSEHSRKSRLAKQLAYP